MSNKMNNIIPSVLPNGATILKLSLEGLFGEGVVLAEINKLGWIEYVTWRFYNGDLNTTHTGHYFGSPNASSITSYKNAEEDFLKRSR